MAAPRTVSRDEGLAARRWDAVVLGSGLAGLVAATRLGMAGHRVLVVQEKLAAEAFAGLREPFFLAGAREQGLIDACLRELTLPLIDRRRIVEQPLAFQIVGPDLRLDVGEPGLTAQELVAWGVAKPEHAASTVRSLAEAAEAERRAMLSAPVVRVGRRIARGRPGTQGSHVRGLPAEAASPSAEIAPILDAEVRALSNLATARPSPEARARLLGSVLGGGAGFSGDPPWLAGLMRKRAESVHVEFREISGPIDLVQSNGMPGLVTSTGALWLGRALVLAAPGTALAKVIAPENRPGLVDVERPARQRVAVHLRCKTSALPEGMGPRLLLLPDPGEPDDGLGVVTLALYEIGGSTDVVDAVARAVVEPPESNAALRTVEDGIDARVRRLLTFADRKLTRRKIQRPVWDDDDWLEDPPPGLGWPADIELRVSVKPPVYRLDRGAIAGLGVEGDLLLGWRGGDAIAAEI